MNPAAITEIFNDPVTRSLIERAPLMRVAYTGTDGSPRVIPSGYIVRGTDLVMGTIPTSVKVQALRADPRAAVTIDVGGMPPCCLLVRGRATLEDVDGVPDDYLEASFRTMPSEMHEEFERNVRSIYDSMTLITITPTWARLLDFERTAPQEVERLSALRGAGNE